MTKYMLGEKGLKMSSRQRQRLIKWLPIRQEILMATHKMTFKIIND